MAINKEIATRRGVSLEKEIESNRQFSLSSETYRSDVQYSDDVHSAAKRALAKIDSVLSDCDDYLKGKFRADVNEEQLLQNLFLTKLKVQESFRDDFDFAAATAAVTNLVRMLGKELEETDTHSSTAFVAVSSLKDYIRQYFNTLGINLRGKAGKTESGDNVREIVDVCVNFRSDVRSAALSLKSEERVGFLKLCDKVRDDLKLRGFMVKDRRS